jgi:hypothetical protein
VGGVQRSGETASIGPGGAIYRKRKGREGRTAGERRRRGGAVLAAALGVLGTRGCATGAG